MNLPEKKNPESKCLVNCIEHDFPMWKIWKLMKANKRKFLPVVKDGEFIGVIRGTDVSMLSTLNPGNLDISDIIEREPLRVGLDSSLKELIASLTRDQVDYAVLLDPEGAVLDVLNVGHVLNYMNQAPPDMERAKVEQLYLWRLQYGNY